ncbi:amidohydrolase family protein [Saccharothrix obliqua]|uniref:amidohydrolase family protein n=1 Tax=Saccharothrix obliqua TaxID=2861747 RepID=UPI001C5E1D65|nr:amidohydrolase family protein [Saccharothrix obliqua]MBW4721384.1 amidohydrolase family protein [Saccharothrix obliqua]
MTALPGIRVDRALVGPRFTPVDDAWLLFDGPRIAGIGSGPAPVRLPRFAGVAVPGLVDCHVHLAMDGGADVVAELAGRDEDDLRATMAANARRHVASGVTTVRDLGSPGHLALRHPPTGPDVPTVVAAAAIGHPDGHGNFLAAHARTPEEFVHEVEAAAELGARWVKLFATGGVITSGTRPGAPQMTPRELAAVVTACRRLGIRVAAHAHGAEGIAHAVHAAVDSVEHFSYLDDRLAETVTRGSVALVCTLVATTRFTTAPDRDRARPDTLAKILDHEPHERAALALAARRGIPVVAGTDAGTTFNPHGGGLAELAVLLAGAGVPAPAVLRALTGAGAALLAEPCGQLVAGRRADVAVFAADPLASPDAYASPNAVVVRGALSSNGA